MKVSILIPTYNAERYIVPLLTKLHEQEGEFESEIVIIDSSSKDRTVPIIREQFPNVQVQVIPNHEFEHGGTRNRLAALATGDYLVYMTQDALPYDRSLIRELLGCLLEDDRAATAYARQLPYDDASPLEKFARTFNYTEQTVVKDVHSIDKMGIKAYYNSNVCCMYRRSVFDNLGGFPEKLILNEDLIYAANAIHNGHQVVYCAQAQVFHSHNYSLKQQFKRYFDIGMAFADTMKLLGNVSNEKEGFRFVIGQMRYLADHKQFASIPRVFFETAAKYAGYLLGKKGKNMPHRWKRMLSAYLK